MKKQKQIKNPGTDKWMDKESTKKVCLHCTVLTSQPCNFDKNRQASCPNAVNLVWNKK